MLCATSESALRYFSAHGGADFDPRADSADDTRQPRQETADPFPDETMATEETIPDTPSGAVSLRGGARDVAPALGIGPIQWQDMPAVFNCHRRGAGEQTPLLALAYESLCSQVQADRRTEQ